MLLNDYKVLKKEKNSEFKFVMETLPEITAHIGTFVNHCHLCTGRVWTITTAITPRMGTYCGHVNGGGGCDPTAHMDRLTQGHESAVAARSPRGPLSGRR